MPRLWIRDPLAIFADGADRGLIVEDHRITELVAAGQEPRQSVDTVFDASQHVVLPGLVNTHHHFYQTLTRALVPALGKELFGWLRALYPVWARVDPEMLSVATELALAELCCRAAPPHPTIITSIQRGWSRRSISRPKSRLD